MAVNSITFGGVNSADFGIYISGEGVFNAPKRDVEMIAIPGRNGELALDKGRFENIEVTYPAFNFEPNDYETFAKNLSDFRNAICSLRGYQRLTDTFHPDEYRMAAYIGGLEIKPIKYNTASEFSIIFDCKPQRYLTDGETPITLGEWGEVETVSGDIVEIDNLGIEAVKSLSVELEPIQNGEPWISALNTEPYQFRQVPTQSHEFGNEIDKLVGGTVAWNQMIPEAWRTSNAGTLPFDSGTSITQGHKYLIWGNRTDNSKQSFMYVYTRKDNANLSLVLNNAPANGGLSVGTIFSASASGISDGTTTQSEGNIWLYQGIGDSYVKFSNALFFDLTQMFGSTIADYIYALETATAGAGVAWFKKLFNKPYYAYNAGELKSVSGLVSHDMTGFNQWDEEWEVGGINHSTGQNNSITSVIRSKNYIPCIPSTSYCFSNAMESAPYLHYYDADKNFIGYVNIALTTVFVTPANACFMRFNTSTAYGTTYKNDICINISWDGSRNGEYEPYDKHSYPLDTDLTLRGIPKLDANNSLYYDGDVYEADGTVTRKYGIVDLGTLTWAYDTTGTYPFFRSNGLMGIIKNVTANSVAGNMLCSRYKTTNANAPYAGNDTNCICEVTFGQIQVYDTAYSDAPTFKTAMNGVYLVYELATPTTETADPYTNPQIVDDFGTEEYVTTSIVPIGHSTSYANICPISGYDEVNVYVSPNTSETDATVYTTTLGRTVYGGEVEVVEGSLSDKIASRTVTASEITQFQEMPNWFNIACTADDDNKGSVTAHDVLMDRFARRTVIMQVGEWGKEFADSYTVMLNTTDLEEAKSIITGTQITYPLKTPSTYDLTGNDVELIEGNNYIWSDSGDITVEHGQNPNYLVNPTRFESSPLLMVEGYGNISFNGYGIELEDAVVGEIDVLSRATTNNYATGASRSMANAELINEGDAISLSLSHTFSIRAVLGSSRARYAEVNQITSITNSLTDASSTYEIKRTANGANLRYVKVTTDFPTFEFAFGTSSTQTNRAVIVGSTIDARQTVVNFSQQYLDTVVSYDADTNKISWTISMSHASGEDELLKIGTTTTYDKNSMASSATADSTKNLLGHPTYVDCDLGEAYRIDGGETFSLNRYIDLGSDLPKLAVGANEVTADDTVTELQIVPRWWRI